jgi:tetratricopeptide (TPR) repeat protein
MQLTWTERWSASSAANDRAVEAKTRVRAASPPPLRTVCAVAVVIAAAVLPYLNALGGDFTFDDIGVIRDNPAVQVFPAWNLLTYVYPFGDLYRPLAMLTYAANATMSPAPFGFHLVNVLLHAAVSAAVLAFARLVFAHAGTSDALLPALIAALIFAVHPVHTEAVANVVGRAELLSTLGVLVSLLAFARAIGRTGAVRMVWIGLSLLAFAAALLSKESAFTELGLVVIVSVYRRHRLGAVLLPYLVVGAAYLWLRHVVVGSLTLPARPPLLDNPLAYVDAGTRIRTAVVVLWEYVSQLAFPLRLSADYSFNEIPLALTWSDPRFLLAAATLAALVLGCVIAAFRAPPLCFAVLFACIAIGLTSNIPFPIGTIKAERLLYLPSVGWCLAAGWVAAMAMRRRPACGAVLAVVVLACAGLAAARNADWRDDYTLFLRTAATAPHSAKAHRNRAVALIRAGALDAAEAECRETLRIYPQHASAAFTIGTIYERRGDFLGALWWYEDALRREPEFVKAHAGLCQVHRLRGENDSAEAACRAGLEREPDNLLLLVDLAWLRLAADDLWETRGLVAKLDQLRTLDRDEQAAVAMNRDDIVQALGSHDLPRRD